MKLRAVSHLLQQGGNVAFRNAQSSHEHIEYKAAHLAPNSKASTDSQLWNPSYETAAKRNIWKKETSVTQAT